MHFLEAHLAGEETLGEGGDQSGFAEETDQRLNRRHRCLYVSWLKRRLKEPTPMKRRHIDDNPFIP